MSAGEQIGVTKDNGVPVFASATHDTASAVAAVPASNDKRKWAFLSSGTWSVLGAEFQKPVLSRQAFEAGMSNEGGVGGTTRLLQNIMGLWLVQECRRLFSRRENREFTYAELQTLAELAPSSKSIINATDHRFLAPTDMITEILKACAEIGHPVPESPGHIIRCCLESLAAAYRHAINGISSILGQPIDVLYIVGGGCNNRLLNQLTADICGITVISGPSEATALGNALGQLKASGAISGWDDTRRISAISSSTETFEPDRSKTDEWAERLESLDKVVT